MFTILRGGCFSRHSTDFVMERPNGLPFCYVLLLIKSACKLEIDGVHQSCKPNSALIIKPGTPYFYHNPEGDYIDDWIHFTCEPNDLVILPDEMFHHAFSITNPRLLTTYLQQLLWENNFCDSASKEQYVDALFQIVLGHLRNDFETTTTEEYHPYKYKLQKVRLDIQAAPYKKYTAKDVADSLGISPSYFQSLYRQFFGIAFQADIITIRVDYAKELIASTSMTLEQIAYACGYTNEVHFYRQFLAKTGMTPGEFRRSITP